MAFDARGTRGRAAAGASRVLGTTALVVLAAACFALAAAAASRRSALVPSAHRDFPAWLAGPLHGLGLGVAPARFQVLVAVICAGYAIALACASRLSPAPVAAAIAACHVALLLGPPLFSADVLGYLDFARLGVLHHLSPYAHSASGAPHDAIAPYVTWHSARSPYGPLFTLGTYALVGLGPAAGLWVLKALTGLASLGTLALVWRSAPRLGVPALRALVFAGLNPVLLVCEIGGAHNDTLMLALALAAVAAVLAARPATAGATLAAAVAVKATAGVFLPFLLLGTRAPRRLLAGAGLAGGAFALAGLAVLGPDLLQLPSNLRAQQDAVAAHSLPAVIAGTVDGRVRLVCLALALAGVVVAAWRAHRTGDWVAGAGWALLAILVTTAWLLPWYAAWLLPFAALARDRALRPATLAFCAYALATRLPALAPLFALHHR
jgi:Glycosyltransferase family 87